MPVQASIRHATREDVLNLAQVHVQSWLETYSGLIPHSLLDSITVEARAAQWARTFEQPHGVFVAIVEDAVVGFASCGQSQEPGFDTELFTLYVLKAFQGQKLGRRLWQAALEFTKAQSAKSLILWVLESNPSRGFYEHVGGVFKGQKLELVHGTQLREISYGFDLAFGSRAMLEHKP